MIGSCHNWLDLVNSYVYYDCKTCENLPGTALLSEFQSCQGFEIHWVRQYLVNVVLFGIKDL